MSELVSAAAMWIKGCGAQIDVITGSSSRRVARRHGTALRARLAGACAEGGRRMRDEAPLTSGSAEEAAASVEAGGLHHAIHVTVSRRGADTVAAAWRPVTWPVIKMKQAPCLYSDTSIPSAGVMGPSTTTAADGPRRQIIERLTTCRQLPGVSMTLPANRLRGRS